MFSTVLRARQISSLRPLRPPNSLSQRIPTPRLFTQNTPLPLLSPRASLRPQLPYLAQPAFANSRSHNGAFARFLSTETKEYIRETSWQSVRWTVIIGVFTTLGSVVWFGIQLELDERSYPTPGEWTQWSRWRLRSARAKIRAGEEMAGLIEWPLVGSSFKLCLDRLEDAAVDGKDVKEIVEGGIIIPEVGKAGFDITAKSPEWRAGYFEVIMNCAKAAEHMDGMVRDNTRNIVFPRAVMIGPSNPDPRPVPPWMREAPREENCTTPFSPPETFYMRVLTSQGFTTNQRLAAVDAYANWLSIKNLPQSATEMYNWGIDIATSAIPIPPDTILDPKSRILHSSALAFATSNLLHATTSLATHLARTGDVATSLPILLSVLRARRTAPPNPPFPSFIYETEEQDNMPTTDYGRFFYNVKKFFTTSSFTLPPDTGDAPLTRISDAQTCEESELMLYIGEILFATSPAASEGLGWTRQAVEIAEKNVAMGGLQRRTSAAREERLKCKECLFTGAKNWEIMVERLLEEKEIPRKKMGWLGLPNPFSSSSPPELSVDRLQEELKKATGLKDRILKDGIEEELLKARGVNYSGLWV